MSEPIDPLSLKGKSTEVHAHRLLEVAPGTAAPARRPQSPMVGRERELAELQQAFDRAVADEACFLFTVIGAAGEGKSRLVDEFVAQLGDRATVVRGRCLPYGEGITYWPVAEAVRDAVALSDFDEPGEVERRLAETLAGEERAPVISARLAEVIGVTEGAAAAEETHWAIRRFFEVLAVLAPSSSSSTTSSGGSRRSWISSTTSRLVPRRADPADLHGSTRPARPQVGLGGRQGQRHDDPASAARRRGLRASDREPPRKRRAGRRDPNTGLRPRKGTRSSSSRCCRC